MREYGFPEFHASSHAISNNTPSSGSSQYELCRASLRKHQQARARLCFTALHHERKTVGVPVKGQNDGKLSLRKLTLCKSYEDGNVSIKSVGAAQSQDKEIGILSSVQATITVSMQPARCTLSSQKEARADCRELHGHFLILSPLRLASIVHFIKPASDQTQGRGLNHQDEAITSQTQRNKNMSSLRAWKRKSCRVVPDTSHQ